MAITILELAKYRGAKPARDGSISGDEFDRVGLPILGGCEVCHACVAAHNACPSRTGFLRCANGCIGELGWDAVEEADAAIFGDTTEDVDVAG